MRDLVPFAQFEKRGKHPYTSVALGKISTSLRMFFTVLKLYKWYLIEQSISHCYEYSKGTGNLEIKMKTKILMTVG